MRYVVLHRGVPLGSVELPEGREWSGGTMEDIERGYATVGEILKRASRLAGPGKAGMLWRLPEGDEPDTTGLSAAAAEALRWAADLRFDLQDDQGRPVPVERIRLFDVDLSKGPVVSVFWRTANAGVTASNPPRERDGGGTA